MNYPLTPETNQVLNEIVTIEEVRPYVLIGGSALTIHINHRLSEDLDFAQWNEDKSHRLTINANAIFNSLQKEFSRVDIVNALDNQLDLIVNEIKVTFFVDNENQAPRDILDNNHLKIAGIKAIAAMKIGLLFDRVKFRDYYDLFAIHKSGLPLSQMVEEALKFKPYLNKKLIYIALTDANRTIDEDLKYLNPKYNVTKTEIKDYFTKLVIAEKG